MDDTNPDPKGEHGYQGYWPVVISMEGDGGDRRHPSEGKFMPLQLPTWVPCREGNTGINIGDESGTVVS